MMHRLQEDLASYKARMTGAEVAAAELRATLGRREAQLKSLATACEQMQAQARAGTLSEQEARRSFEAAEAVQVERACALRPLGGPHLPDSADCHWCCSYSWHITGGRAVGAEP